MTLIKYEDHKFNRASLAVIEKANEIIREYQAQGFVLTLRQLYYQFVSRDLLPNKQQSYDKLGVTISKARIAGLVSWDAIEDRTRNLRSRQHWTDVPGIIQSSIYAFQVDMWENQDYRPEVWIEKDALVGIIEGICNELDVPYFACRGYSSQSEQWKAGQRLTGYIRDGQKPVIIHLGDHDPSGLDMTRDNADRLTMFARTGIIVNRIALNYDQVEEYQPPPNPAKLSDSRANAYIEEHGGSSWELDALEPTVISDLVRSAIDVLRDRDRWEKSKKRQSAGQSKIKKLLKYVK